MERGRKGGKGEGEGEAATSQTFVEQNGKFVYGTSHMPFKNPMENAQAFAIFS